MQSKGLSLLLALAILEMAWAACTEKDAAKFIAKVNKQTQTLANALALKEWNYQTTLTDEASKELDDAKQNFFNYRAEVVPKLNKYQWKTFKDPLLKRQFSFLTELDEAAVPQEKRSEYFQLLNKMFDLYNKAVVKEYKSDNGKTLDYNEVQDKLSDDYFDACEMSYYWQGWHDTVGNAEKPYFEQYVTLANDIAKLNGFKDNAELWQARYETNNFEELIANLSKQIDPLVKQIHAYLRRKLYQFHGKDPNIVDLQGPISASLLGNLWGMSGIGIYNETVPYSDVPSVDATPQLIAQKYDALKMAKAAEKFFVSLGMPPMTETFWKNSILEQPKDKNIVCTEEAVNFYDGNDYRLDYYCATPSLNDFGGIHHEMGKVEDFMAWKNLPYAFQSAPNPGFAETIGELVNQYVTSPNHLKALGLLDANWQADNKQEINYLLQQALYDVLFLPYAYSLDLWRWRVFQGKVTPENYNCEYWKARVELQGVEPPVDRSAGGLDPAAKSYIINNEDYIKFFVNIILQYQWHRALCITAKEFDPKNPDAKPLYLCDITGNTDAGDKLKKMMALGASKPWQDAMEIITGEREMNATSMLEYFKPLQNWLEEENKKNGDMIGWNPSKKNFCNANEVSPKTTKPSPCQYTS